MSEEKRPHSVRGIATYDELKTAIGEAVGEASVCWVGGTRQLEFDSTAASRVADRLYQQVRAHRIGEALGEVTTRELLEELRMRGDLAMVTSPTTPRGQDGSFLSAAAGMLLRSCVPENLEAVRGA